MVSLPAVVPCRALFMSFYNRSFKTRGFDFTTDGKIKPELFLL
ncbi:hypothetical protein HMPREF9554_00962 [Treponema phagedenis F0421]|nr:hypothetical protein HMPREF9554_00962 [Treponema phagedenis F0421]